MDIARKILQKLNLESWYPFYNWFYDHLGIKPKTVLLESRGGNALEGNILRILEELSNGKYGKFTLVLSVKKSAAPMVKSKLNYYKIRKIRTVRTGSIFYYYMLARAEYLVNDTSFPGRFIKKDGQIYLNTWHGTPLKKMGRDNKNERYSMGNVMRNLLQSDYLLFPNRYMEEKMTGAYMLSGLYQGIVLREGYPRNSVFFQDARRKTIREELGCQEKKMIVYMPTFRGNVEHVDISKQNHFLVELFLELEQGLEEDQQFFYKLHPLADQPLELENCRHIKSIPENYDIYDVLNACDILITDYSSIMYDFAVTGRQIILFIYDAEEYDTDRGIYEDIMEYPFTCVYTVKELLKALKSKNTGMPDQKFIDKYCTYEHTGSTEQVCRHIFMHQKICTEYWMTGDGKENILIYVGDLAKNGITTALLGMLNSLDRERFHYYLSFRRISLETDPKRLEALPDDFGIIPIPSKMNLDIVTAFAQLLYFRKGKRYGWITRCLNKSYTREWKKLFGTLKFRHVIHYNGYERYIIALFSRFSGRKTIWVHNDMRMEISEKGNQNLYQLQDAYRIYDNVVVVSQDIYQSTVSISGREDNIRVIGNVHNVEEIKEKALKPLEFDRETESDISLVELEEIMDSNAPKFINIGRFSIEKGHKRLIEAFDNYWKEHQDTYLIIIGGTGILFDQTKQWAAHAAAHTHIILIKYMKNPMPVLKKCQLFILSSIYEGLGLVILEADTLGVPVIACDVPGPAGFMREHHGVLVESSKEGILKGMRMYNQGLITSLDVDYSEMNRVNIKKCERLM